LEEILYNIDDGIADGNDVDNAIYGIDRQDTGA
jgi:hypothetical protein